MVITGGLLGRKKEGLSSSQGTTVSAEQLRLPALADTVPSDRRHAPLRPPVTDLLDKYSPKAAHAIHVR